ncbi:MAG TPA: histidine phosphatase family protein [Thermomicrobiales bacterium]|nr:histidine phosphatase family protein [Thermomicrobiales bacterium]
MQLLLIRHGQSQANIDHIIQDDHDPLTDLGRQQADSLGRHLAASREITHLYSSPLARARETAEIIGRHIGLDPVFEPGLAEINAGTAAGMTWDAWTEAYPEIAARLRSAERSLDDRWEGGESGHEFVARVYAAYDHIVGQHLGTDDVVAAVSHGGALAWIASRLHGDPDDVWPYERAVFGNASVSEILIDEDGSHTIGAWNQTDHLTVELR